MRLILNHYICCTLDREIVRNGIGLSIYRCFVSHLQLMRLIGSKSLRTPIQYETSSIHLFCCYCYWCHLASLSERIPYNCNIIVPRMLTDIPGHTLSERIQPRKKKTNHNFITFCMQCQLKLWGYISYSVHGFSTPPAFAVAFFANHQHLTALPQWQLIRFSWGKVIQCGCNHFSEWP